MSNSAGSLSKDPLLLQAEALSRNLAVPVLVHEGPKPAHKCVEQVAAHFLSSREALVARGDEGPTEARATTVGQVVYSPLARARASHLAAAAAGASTSTITATKAGPPTPTRLLVIGDRLATDMILAHRLSALSFPLSVPSSSPSPSTRRFLPFLLPYRRASRRALGTAGTRIEAVPVLTTHLWAREGWGTTLLRWVERGALWGLDGRKKRATASGARDGGEEEQWERFVVGRTAPGGAEAAAAVENSPSVPRAGAVMSRSTPSSSSSAAPTSPSPRPKPSLPSLPPLPSLSSLSTLPTRLSTSLSTLPTRLSALPTRLLSLLSALPTRLLSLLSRLTHHTLQHLESRLPALLARLARPDGALARAVCAYRTPGKLAPLPTGAMRPLGRRLRVGSAPREGEGQGRVDEWLDGVERRVEGVWGEARQRAEAGRGVIEGVRSFRGWELVRGRKGAEGKRV